MFQKFNIIWDQPVWLGLLNILTATLQRGKITSQRVSWYDIKPLENTEYPFIAIVPGPLWPGVVVSVWVLSMGQIELFDI